MLNMNWLTNEVIFYGGIITIVGSLIMAVIYFISSHIQYIHLNVQLDEEYGKEEDGK